MTIAPPLQLHRLLIERLIDFTSVVCTVMVRRPILFASIHLYFLHDAAKCNHKYTLFNPGLANSRAAKVVEYSGDHTM